MSKHRSVSQYNAFTRCAYRYKLERVDKVWQRPASWLSQGLGVHKAMEEWEKSGRALSMEELEAIYSEEYTASIDAQAEDTPNLEYWFGSGPYPGPQDIERRFTKGLEQLHSLVSWCQEHEEVEIWETPDGDKAIELGFEVELGGVLVKGFIDQIVLTPKGLVVRDIKTGAKPGDAFQLATYSEAVRLLYGVKINRGDYFMGKTGRPGRAIIIDDNDRARVHERFRWLEEQIQAERFDPSPSIDTCRMCAVRAACEFAEG